MKSSKLALGVSVFCMVTAACSYEERGQAPGEEAVGTARERLFVLKATLWEDPSHIPVCWETAGFDTEKGWVVNALVTSWEAAAPRIHFTGFAACTAADKGIRVVVNSFDEEGPHVVDFGRNLAGVKNGMTLDFAFSGPDFPRCTTSEAMRERCIRAIATHEFGHALGFRHEQARADTPASCTLGREPAGTDGTAVGAWDLMSIMNYCYPDRETVFPTMLSPTDSAGAREMYPSLATPDAGPDSAATNDADAAAPGSTNGGANDNGTPSPSPSGSDDPASGATASAAAPAQAGSAPASSGRVGYMAPAEPSGCSASPSPSSAPDGVSPAAWALALCGVVLARKRRR